MLQKLKTEIAECYQRALALSGARTNPAIWRLSQDFLDMERRWTQLAHSYEFAERLSNFTGPFRKHK